MYPSEHAAGEMRVLMDATGFSDRLAAMGAPVGAGAALAKGVARAGD